MEFYLHRNPDRIFVSAVGLLPAQARLIYTTTQTEASLTGLAIEAVSQYTAGMLWDILAAQTEISDPAQSLIYKQKSTSAYAEYARITNTGSIDAVPSVKSRLIEYLKSNVSLFGGNVVGYVNQEAMEQSNWKKLSVSVIRDKDRAEPIYNLNRVSQEITTNYVVIVALPNTKDKGADGYTDYEDVVTRIVLEKLMGLIIDDHPLQYVGSQTVLARNFFMKTYIFSHVQNIVNSVVRYL